MKQHSDMLSTDLLVCLVAASLTVFIYYRNNKPPLPLPPGPRKLPILGNLLDLPTRFEWLSYIQWGKQLNTDILHLSAAGKDIVILNSLEAVSDLLDNRSAIYSSRPPLPMINEHMGYQWLLILEPYGKQWREHRTLFQKYFTPSGSTIHRPATAEHVHKLLLRLLHTPVNFQSHIEHMVGGIIISLAYGLDVLPVDDPYVHMSRVAIEQLLTAYLYIVNYIPALKYLPQSFPGAGFKRKIVEWRAHGHALKEVPFSAAEKAIFEENGRTSLISLCLDDIEHAKDPALQRKILKETAATFFIAGFDTTSSTLDLFILVMLCYPEVQKKAQREIDMVIGHERLPDFNDDERLPYLSAVIKEIIRWRPIVPMGVPHENIKEDVYNGYYIPKNSIVLANIWAILHNEQEYPNPDEFNPERFLKDGKINTSIRDPFTIVFGFGRRACPGRSIALSSIWYTAATVLSVFDISNFVDENGNTTKPTMEFLSGPTLRAVPFKCSIKPRSKQMEDLVKLLDD